MEALDDVGPIALKVRDRPPGAPDHIQPRGYIGRLHVHDSTPRRFADMTGASEYFELARDFGQAPAKVASALFDAYRGAGEGFRDDWQHNARATSGEHGKYYPGSITTEMKFAGFGIEVETGPDSSMKQGGMGRGFEFGSMNQPPHLDGLRAMPLAAVRLDRLADAAIGFALP